MVDFGELFFLLCHIDGHDLHAQLLAFRYDTSQQLVAVTGLHFPVEVLQAAVVLQPFVGLRAYLVRLEHIDQSRQVDSVAGVDQS